MWYVIKRLSLGFALILITSAILLASDWRQHHAPSPKTNLKKVALFSFTTSALLEAGAEGVKAGLAKKGFTQGDTMQLTLFNAEGDLPTATSIAKAIVDSDFDLVVSISTPALQTMAAANQEGKLPHVFGMVTDPFHAGVGINPDAPLDHPPHLAGIGTFQPVEKSFKLAKELCPTLQTVGVAWNPGETCSEACTEHARVIAKELGIELLETHVENTAGVYEAVSALVARGAQAIYVGGDNTVETAIDSVVKAARDGNIAVFSNTPSDLDHGTTFNLGANYYRVGEETGILAGEILQGRDPRSVTIQDVMPQKLALNLTVMRNLNLPWNVSPALVESADIVIDDTGRHEKNAIDTPEPSTGVQLSKKWNLHFLNYVEASTVEEAHRGFFEQFEQDGLVEGRDYSLKMVNAQGDMATLMMLVDAAASAQADMVLLTSTPTFQAALQKLSNIPIVFTNVANPVIAGGGESNEDHLPNVAGVFTMSDFEGMIEVVQECLPQAKKVGTLFVPAEVNSVYYKDALMQAAQKAGLEGVSIGSATSADVADSALALTSQNVDAICQISDNLHGAAFSSIVEAARKSQTPLFAFVSGAAKKEGAAVAVARDYTQGGRDMAELALRIMQGQPPAALPFIPISKTNIIINKPNARLCGLELPASLLQKADEIIE